MTAPNGDGDTVPIHVLTDLLAAADEVTLDRAVLAVAAMHEPDGRGRCRACRTGPADRWWRRWWSRRPAGGTPCPTHRVLWTEIGGGGHGRAPRFTPT